MDEELQMDDNQEDNVYDGSPSHRPRIVDGAIADRREYELEISPLR